MGAEIDRLEVAVEAQASKANQQLDLLINKLLKVSNTLTGLNINGFSGMAAGVRNLSAAMKTMSGVKAADFTKTAKGIERLGGVNTSNFQNTAQNVHAMADACIALSGVKAPQIDTNGITALAKSMGVLSKIDSADFVPVASRIRQIADSMTILGGANTKDTGINNTINALKRLVETKLEGFDTAMFGQITQSIAALGGVPDVSRNLNQFIGSLSRLAAAGPATQQTANALPALAANLRAAITAVSGAGNISDSVNMFVQSVGRLATAGNKTGQTAAQLDALAKETLKFFQTMTQAPHISQNTIAMTQALAQLASAGGRVGTATGTVTNAFRRLSSIGKSTLSSVKKVANGIVSSFKKIGNSSGHINTATFSLRNLFRAVLPLLGIRQLFNWGKQAVEVASDLTEVQNVVDVTFGDMRDKANEFASTALRSLGMSELSAKQISSRFQAMGTAMGIESSAVSKASEFLEEHSRLYGKTASSMADMSIEVTKLAADMASFYNVEQADVAKDLEAIFTGQTRPLRTYGLDLTQATLQEWALKNGLDANVQSMSQAEKTLLRYQYVMANTGAAQGDFARTAGTWANQTRILAQSFQVLGSTVGNVLINVFKPLVSWLNTVMLKVISVVETIANALGAIFGWTMEITPGGTTSDYDDMADGIGGVGDAADAAGGSLDKATEKAKEFQRFLAGFDEIEKIPDESDIASGSGGSSGGGSGGSGDGAGGGADAGTAQLVQTESLFEKYKSDIETLEQLGEYIGQTLTDTLREINWDKIYENARGFGSGLASFLNGLIDEETFGVIGDTAASVLNTILHGLDSFGDTFEWDEFGKSLAGGLKSFLGTFNWNLAVETFNTLANGILDTAIAALGEITAADWKRIPQKIADMISAIDVAGITWKLGSIANSLVNAFYLLVSDKSTWSNLGKQIANGINNFFDSMGGVNADTGLTGWQALGKSIHDTIIGFADTIITALDNVDWESVGNAIGDFLKALNWPEILAKLGEVIWKAIGTALETWKSSFDAAPVETAIVSGLIALKFSGIGASFGKTLWGKIKDAVLGKTVLEEGSTAVSGGLVSGIVDSLKTAFADGSAAQGFAGGIAGSLTTAATMLGGPGTASFDVIGNKIVDKISEGLDALLPDWAYDTLSKIGAGLVVGAGAGTAIPGLGTVAGAIIGGIGGFIASDGCGKIWEGIKKGWDKVSDKVLEVAAKVKDDAVTWWSNVKSYWSAKAQNLEAKVIGVVDTAKDWWSGIRKTATEKIGSISASIHGAVDTTKNWWSGVRNTVSEKVGVVTSAVKGAMTEAGNWWDGVRSSIVNKVGTATAAVKGAMTKAGNWWDGVRSSIGKKVGEVKATIGGLAKTTGWATVRTVIKGRIGTVNSTIGGSASTASKLWAGVKQSVLKKIGVIKSVVGGAAETAAAYWRNLNANIARKIGTVTVSVKGRYSGTSGGNRIGLAAGGIFVNGSWRPVTAAASGGAFNMGQMFIAREAGPELVGTIGGHTAVMNNDQIVSSVSDGVYRAVSAAMAQSGGQSGAAPTFNIYIGGRQVTDFVVEDINGRTMATGTCPILT